MFHAMAGSSILPYKGILPRLGSGVLLAAGAQVIGDFVAEEDVSIWFNTVIRADCNFVRIGARTNVQDGTVIHVTSGEFPTIIGSDVTIGHSAIIHSCNIGKGSLIGMGSIILDGAEIGENSVVAAGSIVTPGKRFPPGSMIMGAPAKVTRELNAEEISALKASVAAYLEYKNNYIYPVISGS